MSGNPEIAWKFEQEVWTVQHRVIAVFLYLLLFHTLLQHLGYFFHSLPNYKYTLNAAYE